MKLFLTGADNFMANQKNGYQSLGGFQSSTPVPNNRLDFLFGTISYMTIKNALSECVGLILVNDSGSAVTNVKLKYIYNYIFKTPNYQASYQVAAVTLDSKNQQMERISSRYDLPFYGEFHDASFRRADLIGDITYPASVGDTITILGVTTDPVIDTAINAIVSAFSGNATCSVIKISDTSVYFQYKSPVDVNIPIDFSTNGSCTMSFSSATLTNDYDNEVILSASLAAGAGIGLWFKRDIVPVSPESNEQYYLDWQNNVEKGTNESLETIISWT